MDSSPRIERAPRALICVTGGIAAYKAPDLVSLFRKRGFEVRCALTQASLQFVSPLALETLTGAPARSSLFAPGDPEGNLAHIELARWCDVLVFAPLTANSLAKLALGLADDLVSTIALASRDRPWVLAPAMNTAMWEAPPTRENVARLRARETPEIRWVNPATGLLACGEVGEGKLAPLEQIADEACAALANRAAPSGDRAWSGRTILITAGPTRSFVDAVRYMTNPSTGRMGAALAEEALRRGARVIYVSGRDKGVVTPSVPVGTDPDALETHWVETAEEMRDAALAALPRASGVLATAAVLDYRFEKASDGKSRRSNHPETFTLHPSADVLGALREAARADQWVVGFAAETAPDPDSAADPAESWLAAAGRLKLERKKLDAIFVNEVSRRNRDAESKTGFGVSTNAGIWIASSQAGSPVPIALAPKTEVATRILDLVSRLETFDARET